MGKHSMKKERNYKKVFIIIICVLILAAGIYAAYYVVKKYNNNINEKYTYSISSRTEEGNKLVLKDNSVYCRYIEFTFNDNTLTGESIYEQFEEKNKYENKKNNYELQKAFNLTKFDDDKLVLEVEKQDLGDDTGLSYEDIYDKYVNQIIGAYSVMK